jgi:threonine dehydrogenase-like Zn-dependent dehydrogenase
MADSYLAAEWHGTRSVDLVPKTIREPQAGEILVKVKAAGICGTDLHLIDGGYPGCRPPLVPGHEFSGQVVALGPQVEPSWLGRRIGCDSYLGCGRCINCLQGKHHLCRYGPRELGVHVDGGWAEYVIVPAENVFQLPDNVSFEEAGAGCILNCPLAAVEKIGVQAGDTVLLIGDGPSSLMMVQLARLAGVGEVIVLGHREKRMRLAKTLGADRTIDTRAWEIRSFAVALRKRPEVIIDAVGKAETLNWALELAGVGTRIHFFGLPAAPLNGLDLQHLLFKEILLTSSTGNPLLWPTAMRYLSAGLLRIKPLLSHRFRLTEINTGLACIRQNPGEIIKALLVMD